MKVCVYCSASERIEQKYKDLAYDVGCYLAKNNFSLVYGGGKTSMMGAVASGMIEAGGYGVGIIPEHLKQLEGEHPGLQELYVVDSMHTRKMQMAQAADAFLILPGGFGTLDEFFEIITWKQLSLHNKPILIFNAFGYWDKLVELMYSVIDAHFARPEHREIFDVIHHMDEIEKKLRKNQHV